MSTCCTFSLRIYKKRKGEQFGHFHNDKDVICKSVSIDDHTNAGEEIENKKTIDAEELDNVYK